MTSAPLTAMVIEDDPIIAADLVYLLKDFGYSPYPALRNYDDALLFLEKIVPDFVLIDVSLEGKKDGIDLAHEINKNYDLPLIFLTAHHDKKTIERIKETKPGAYLVKPVEEHNLLTAIELAIYNHENRLDPRMESKSISADLIEGDNFYIKVKNQLIKLSPDKILFLEAYDNYVYLHTREEKHLLNSNMKTLEAKLPETDFMRVHRSFMVNLQAIEKIEEESIIIKDQFIPIGKTYRDQFMKRIKLL